MELLSRLCSQLSASTPTKLLPAHTHCSQNLNPGFWLIHFFWPGMPSHSSFFSAKTASTYSHMWNLLNSTAQVEYSDIHQPKETFLDYSRPAMPHMMPGTSSLALIAMPLPPAQNTPLVYNECPPNRLLEECSFCVCSISSALRAS